jgi:hypothetical protein
MKSSTGQLQPRHFPPVTLGHIRGHGCRGVLVYCESIWCNHSADIDADCLPDDTVIRSLGPRNQLSGLL